MAFLETALVPDSSRRIFGTSKERTQVERPRGEASATKALTKEAKDSRRKKNKAARTARKRNRS